VNSLEESIKELDDSIADIIQEVNKINLEVIETKNQIAIQTKTINLLKKKIESNTEVLLEYITYMYKRGDSLSEGGDIDTIKTILLS
jgi:septal ring factor EnvC (AmiA/AmiB activator)